MGLSIEPDPKRDAARTFSVLTAVVVGLSVLWWKHDIIAAELTNRFSPAFTQVANSVSQAAPRSEQQVQLVYSAIVTPEVDLTLSAEQLAAVEHETSPGWSDWPESTEVQHYIVQDGDTLWGIAVQFDLDLDTLRWSNPDLEANPDLLLPGSELIILPLVGAYHTVADGDTLASIAAQYGVAEIDITNYPANRFVTTDQLEPGRKLVIPFGRKDPIVSQPALDLDYALTWPVAGPVVRDYDDNHQGLDLSSSYGAEVRAAEAGTVYYIGQSQTGYGFTIAIDHGLNRQTLYSHLQAATVQQGEQISRGQVIGSIGSTGDPGGPYVHFELRESGESRNPLLYLNVSGAL